MVSTHQERTCDKNVMMLQQKGDYKNPNVVYHIKSSSVRMRTYALMSIN